MPTHFTPTSRGLAGKDEDKEVGGREKGREQEWEMDKKQGGEHRKRKERKRGRWSGRDERGERVKHKSKRSEWWRARREE